MQYYTITLNGYTIVATSCKSVKTPFNWDDKSLKKTRFSWGFDYIGYGHPTIINRIP